MAKKHFEPPKPDTTGKVRYPGIKVKLTGHDGNAFAILGRMISAMRYAGVSREELNEFQRQAMSGDYNKLLDTCMRWCDVH